MFMQRIEVPVRIQRPKPAGLKLATGMVVLFVAAIVMPVYWTFAGAWIAISLLILSLRSLARNGYDCLLYAGEAIVGY